MPTYTAKLFEVEVEDEVKFKLAGTLDGFVDFAVQRRTYSLSVEEATRLAAALSDVVKDIQTNCLHDQDDLLTP